MGLFEFTGKLPETNDSITIFSTRLTKEQREKNTIEGATVLSKIFKLKGKPVDSGDKHYIVQRSKRLTLYPASNSFWYMDEALSAAEDKKFSENLPDEKFAKDAAMKFLERNKLLIQGAAVYSASFTTMAVNKPKTEKADEYNTEVHVNFRYTLDKLPVFGPGAKTRVSFVDTKRMSGVYHFWRNAEPTNKRPILKPDLALELFNKNFRFEELKKDNVEKAVIHSMELGYFALPPNDVQHFLIPVYRLRGSISTKQFPRYDFDHYVVAVRFEEEDVKTMGVSIKGVKAMVF